MGFLQNLNMLHIALVLGTYITEKLELWCKQLEIRTFKKNFKKILVYSMSKKKI